MLVRTSRASGSIVAAMLSRRMAWTVALVATFTMTVSYVDRQTLAVLAPDVTKALGITNESYGWLQSAFSIAYLIGTPLAGWWLDRVGARRGMVASVFAWSVVAALHALTPGYGMLFALRLALGITEGPGFPGASQTVQKILPPSDRERGFGVLFTGSSIGAMLVPPFATFINYHANWRVAFLTTAAAGLVWIPLWIAVTRNKAVRAQFDAAGDTVKHPRPSLFAMLSHPVMLRALCAIVAAAPIFGFSQAWGAKYLVKTFSLTQNDVGTYLIVPPLLFDAGAILFGHLASRQRRDEGVPARALFAISIVIAMSLALLPQVTTPWQSMVLMGIANAGGGGMYTIATSDLLSRMPPTAVSFAAGLLACAQSLAYVIIFPLIGRAVDQLGNYDGVGITLGLWALPGGAAWLLWRPPLRVATLPRARVAS
jgi:MFS transporter, ACS family, aldohexuronate transporter